MIPVMSSNNWVEMALITTPIGMNVFVISGMIKDVPTYTIFRVILPFLLAMVLCLALLIVFTQIALFLPNIMIGKWYIIFISLSMLLSLMICQGTVCRRSRVNLLHY